MWMIDGSRVNKILKKGCPIFGNVAKTEAKSQKSTWKSKHLHPTAFECYNEYNKYVSKLLLKMIKQKVAKLIYCAKSGHAVFFLLWRGWKFTIIINDQNLFKFLDQVQAIFLFLSLPWLLCDELELKSDLRNSQFYVHRVLCPGPNVKKLLRLQLTNVCNKQECTSLASSSSLV